MTETQTETPDAATDMDALRTRNQELEQQLLAAQQLAEARLVEAELRAEAVRAGMVDLDGLRLVDPDEVSVDADGRVAGVPALMRRLRQSKPWLFGGQSSSAAAAAPPAEPPKAKRATEMTDTEYRIARAELLRRR